MKPRLAILLLCLFCISPRADITNMVITTANVGTLNVIGSGGGSSTSYLLNESGQRITTEAGLYIIIP